MKFYDFALAPSPRRIRLFLAEKGIELDTVQVDLRSGEHLGEAFRRKNPDCTVPVLELDDGTCISEVAAICGYLEELHPEPPLMGRDARERALVSMWNTKVEQQGLGAAAEMYRNFAKRLENRALTGPHNIPQIPELIERGRLRTEHFFDRLDQHFEDTHYLAGNYFSLADISAFVTIDFAARAKLGIGNSRRNVQRWYDELRERKTLQDNIV